MTIWHTVSWFQLSMVCLNLVLGMRILDDTTYLNNKFKEKAPSCIQVNMVI